MVALALDHRVQQDTQDLEASLRNIRQKKHMMPAQQPEHPLNPQLEQSANETVDKCLDQPDSFKQLWKLFCLNALTTGFPDYQEAGWQLKDRFDRTLAVMENIQRLIADLEHDGYAIPNARRLEQAVRELREMREQIFSSWPVPRKALVRIGPPVLPPWLAEVLEAMNRLIKLPANWDSYDARSIDREVAVKAFELLADIVQPDTPRPQLVPTVRGFVQIEWHVHGIDLEIEFQTPNQLAILYANHRTGRAWERELRVTDIESLVDAVATISDR